MIFTLKEHDEFGYERIRKKIKGQKPDNKHVSIRLEIICDWNDLVWL